ncbi:MAG: ATP-binding cassette domain-containing protein [Planctomycetaceae bacterium]|jgi:excinuclease ABC subunit A|nr:ATP-binding cassette domain-containing protein [Planctomycetaceae bacterium]
MKPIIHIEGARTHNLKNLTLDIPRNQFVVITGPSGSGKSSLAFDTVFAEGQRQFLASLSVSTRKLLRQLDRPDVDRITGLPPTIAVDQRGHAANPRSTVGTLTEIYDYLRLLYARCGLVHCFQCGQPIRQTPQSQIINAILKLPPNCRLVILAPIKTAEKNGHHKPHVQPPSDYAEVFDNIIKAGFYRARIDSEWCDLASPPKLDPAKPHRIETVIDRLVLKEGIRSRLAESLQLALKHGNESVIIAYEDISKAENTNPASAAPNIPGTWHDLAFCTKYACPHCNITYQELEPRTFSFNSPYGACPVCEGTGEKGDGSDSVSSADSRSFAVCPECFGSRLRKEARSVTVADKRIDEISAMPVENVFAFFRHTDLQNEIAKPIAGQLLPRLELMNAVGLGYLTLDRRADTLSGGELQRVRLADALGGGLTGACYVLDEPTTGLHPRDTRRLIETIKLLQKRGNSVLVVEHDETVIRAADYRIEIGPGSGKYGGELIRTNSGTETMSFAPPHRDMNAFIPQRIAATSPVKHLILENVCTHNLKNLTVKFPLQKLICITGVSGSGKSSLINETLVPAVRKQLSQTGSIQSLCSGGNIGKLIEADQTPLGKSSRSNPATYSGLFDELRKLFAQTRDAKRRGWKANRFSFNNDSGGRCEACRGQGTQKIESEFLNDYHAVCPFCNGKRFNRQTLTVRYKGLSIADVLDMPIEDAAGFFANIPPISRILQSMQQIGLGYLPLGQSASMLSGGESQRVKLAAELAKTETGNTLYVLDEPTAGLHRSDVFRLMDVLTGLVEKGNTVIVIEHNLDVMFRSDWLIDLGPEGGERGGYLLAEGTPQEIAAIENNATGQALRSAC